MGQFLLGSVWGRDSFSLAGESGKRTEDIIRNSRLWYSKASAFNDPFDCNLMIAGKAEGEWEEMFGSFVGRVGEDFRLGTASLIRQAGGRVPRLLQPKKTEMRRWQITITDKEGRARDTAEFFNSVQERRLRKMYQILDESFGVLSLSTKPDDILMWSHYSNRHDGVCLEFHTPAHPNAFPRLFPVRYDKQYPYLSPHFPDLLATMQGKGKASTNRLLLDVGHALASGLKDDDTDKSKKAGLGVPLVLCQVGQVGIRRRMARTERRAGFRAVHETGPEGYHRRLREHRGESRVGAKDGRGPASEDQALQGGQEEA